MIFLAILLTAFVYLIFPIIYVANNGKVNPKKGKKLALSNTIVCAAIWFLITLIVVSSTENASAEIGGYSLAPAFFYYFIAKAIFTDKNLNDDDTTKNTIENNNEFPTENDANEDLLNYLNYKPQDEEEYDDENYEENEGFSTTDNELNNIEPIIEKENIQQAEIKKEMTKPNEVMIDINEQQLEDKIAKLQNHNFLSKNITFSYKNIAADKKLEAINAYEGSAQTLYEQGCRWFGFDKEKKVYFKPLQILYATLATPEPEYYSVWFLPHSNINNSTNGTWYNFYEGDTLFQCEIDSSTQTHNKPRITFVKQESGDYVFVGIYKFIKDHAWYKDGKRYYVQAYTKICDTYPENK